MATTVKKNELYGWLASVFQEPPDAPMEGRTRDSIPGWDSMGMLMLMAELDDKLKVNLTEEEIKRLRSVGDLVQLLRSRGVEIEDA